MQDGLTTHYGVSQKDEYQLESSFMNDTISLLIFIIKSSGLNYIDTIK